MKRFIVLLQVVLISFSLCAQTAIVFNGNSLQSYVNQQVTFNQTLHVVGQNRDTLYLSYERLRNPEETYIEGTTDFNNAVTRNRNAILRAYFSDIDDDIRLGATTTNLSARVTGARKVSVSGSVHFSNNTPPTQRPDVGNARLIICDANIQNYFPQWEGTHGASSNEEFQRQHTKIIKALVNINADIYALEEVQTGRYALQTLVNALNTQTAAGRYAYVDDGDNETSVYSKSAFIYRTDKVRPALALGMPYGYPPYQRRCYVQAFDEIATNERFVLSVNHFKAKDGTGSASTNSTRMENVQKVVSFLMQRQAANFYKDDDILVVGDLNCASMEEPIRYLMQYGYKNQLTRFSPTEYSYVYDSQVQYIDHVFATESMETQLTGAAPYHINTDMPYYYGFYYDNNTMYRCSDHDPVIIGLNLHSDATHIADFEAPTVKAFSADGKIFVESHTPIDVHIFDMLGRTVATERGVTQHEFALPNGIYIVRAADETTKLAVMR